jgi:hypothetical protein
MGIEHSIEQLCHMEFNLMVAEGQILRPMVVKFDISDNAIKFEFIFPQNSNISAKCDFELKLPIQLWVLKEKFLLGKQKDLIKTYNPIIFDLLVEGFFSDTMSYPTVAESLKRSELNLLEDLKRLMGLKYPIPMTRLNSYDNDYLKSIMLFHEFTKFDLDNLQALLKILCYIAQVMRALFLNSNMGRYPLKYFDLGYLHTANKETLKTINTVFLLNYKNELLMKEIDIAREKNYFSQVEYKPKLSSLSSHITIENITSLLEGLLAQQTLVLSLAKPTQTTLKYSKDGSSFDVLLARNSFVDDYGGYNFLELSMKVLKSRLRTNIDSLKDFHSKLTSENKALHQPPSNHILLILFFLIMENSIAFYLRVDSNFRQKWMKLFKKFPQGLHFTPKGKGFIKRLILELPNPKINKSAHSFLSLSELYFLYREFQTGVKVFSQLDTTRHPVVEDAKDNPLQLFSFLSKLCIHPYSNEFFTDIEEKLLHAIKNEPLSMLTKSRSFYLVSAMRREWTVKQLHFYYFQYKRLHVYTKHLSPIMVKQLQHLQSVYARSEKVTYSFLNTFMQFYRLAMATENEDADGEELSYQEKLLSKIDEETSRKKEQQEISLQIQLKPADHKQTNKKTNSAISTLFDKTFQEVIQNIPKTSNVVLCSDKER